MHRRGLLLALMLGVLWSGARVAGQEVPPPPVGCSAGTLDSYLGGQICTIGNLTIKGFEYSNTGVTIPASQILVEPFAGPGGPALRFSSGAFFVDAGQQAVLGLTYNIDPPPIIIRGFDEEMLAETPVAPGFVTIDTALCLGGFFPGCTGGGEVGLPQLFLHLAHYGVDDPRNILTGSFVFPLTFPISILGVSHTITLDGGPVGGPGSASFSALDTQANTVPEPGTWLLLGCGLLSLAFLRRRRAG